MEPDMTVTLALHSYEGAKPVSLKYQDGFRMDGDFVTNTAYIVFPIAQGGPSIVASARVSFQNGDGREVGSVVMPVHPLKVSRDVTPQFAPGQIKIHGRDLAFARAE